MKKYERSSQSISYGKANKWARVSLENKIRKSINSFLNTDKNLELEKEYAKLERKTTATRIEKNWKLIPADLKKSKK